MEINDWKRADLLALPKRAWDTESNYDSLLLLSTRRKHDSGWALMAIIGVREGKPVEIACDCCDDIEWKLPAMETCGEFHLGQIRTDCAMRSGAMHVWTRKGKFQVGRALSSVSITLIDK